MIVSLVRDELKDVLYVCIYVRYCLTVHQNAHRNILQLNRSEKIIKSEIMDKCGIDAMAAGSGRRILRRKGDWHIARYALRTDGPTSQTERHK